jgi:hypothetical protein
MNFQKITIWFEVSEMTENVFQSKREFLSHAVNAIAHESSLCAQKIFSQLFGA